MWLMPVDNEVSRLMVNRTVAILLGIAISGVAVADDKKLHFVGDFETGQIQPNGSSHDGFYAASLPDQQTGDEFTVSGQDDFGPSSESDTRIVRSEVVGGQTITPRKGQYFLRTEVFSTKNYLKLNADVKNKPRSKIYLSHDAHRFDFDKEGYAGFSIFVPKNFENELGVLDHRGDSMLFEIASDSSRTLLNLGVWVQKPNNEAHWFLRTWSSATSVDNVGLQMIDLGPVSADKGKWTDFVIRYRFNPFSVDTNPAAAGIPSSKNQMYQGNKGILQFWKAEGAVDQEGNRELVLKVDKVNTPVGLVPHATDKIKHLWRIYKYGWLKNPTTLTHPVWFGFDEIRQGLVERDGTSFVDVAPSSVSCQGDCGGGVQTAPNPPAAVAVD
jgi:hypothetical protein